MSATTRRVTGFVMKGALARKTLGLLLGVISCAEVACSSGGHSTSLGNDDSGRTITLSAGDGLNITLGSIGNQGDPSVSSTVIQYEGSSVVGPANPGGPTILYQFRAVRQGEATITIPFVNPSNPPPFVLDVNVE
jgi:hypothetical protein